MAYLSDDERLKQDQQQQPQQEGGTQQLSQASGVVGGSSPSAARGAGGSTGWTNIQSYLEANKDSAGSANLLRDTVGGEFDKQKADATKAADEFKSQAQSAVSGSVLGQDQASKLLQQASTKYAPGVTNTAGADPNQAISKLKGALSAQYTGPSQFNYALGSNAQQYGSNLSNNFGAIMNELYKTTGTRGAGKLGLQKQLDQENKNLAQARSDLQSKYTGLTSDLGNISASANKAASDAKSSLSNSQSQLKSYLDNQANEANAKIQSSVNDYGSASQRAQAQARDDLKRALQEATNNGILSRWAAARNNPVNVGTFGDDRVWRPDVTPEMMNYFGKYITGGNSVDAENAPGAEGARAQWNAIQDVLGTGKLLANREAPSVAAFDKNQFIKDILAGANEWNRNSGREDESFNLNSGRPGDALLPVWQGSMRR